MIVHNVPQGSPQWLNLRSGRPTASQFHRVITPKTRKRSTQIDQYAREMAAERLLGRPLVTFKSDAMTDGTEREEQAVASYELTRGVDTYAVGFITTDDGRIGASPDRMFDGGLLECKNPKAHTHIGYLLGDGPDDDYRCQLQGQLLVTGCPFVDIISCYPGLPDIVVRVPRDEEFIAELQGHLDYLCATVEALMVRLADMGYTPAEASHQTQPDEDWLGVSDADVEALLGETND